MSGMELMLIAATAAKAGSQVLEGFSEAKAMDDAADAARDAAEDARQAAAIDAGQANEEAERAMGRGRAVAGASGFDVSGSAVDVLADLASQNRYNTNAIIYAGDQERRALLSEAASFKQQGKTAKLNGLLKAGATVLGNSYRGTQLDAPAGGGANAPKPTRTPNRKPVYRT